MKTYTIHFKVVSSGVAQIKAKSQPEAKKLLTETMDAFSTLDLQGHSDNVEYEVGRGKLRDMVVKRDLSNQVEEE
ncbi:MAG TPA: hypothetical protein ENI23_02830 [bacterium]|nr:hypothetical protein [bacterium]